MSTNTPSFGPDPARRAGSVQEQPRSLVDPFQSWENRSRIVLMPIAAPSILGLFGFFAATLIVGSNPAAGMPGARVGQ